MAFRVLHCFCCGNHGGCRFEKRNKTARNSAQVRWQIRSSPDPPRPSVGKPLLLVASTHTHIYILYVKTKRITYLQYKGIYHFSILLGYLLSEGYFTRISYLCRLKWQLYSSSGNTISMPLFGEFLVLLVYFVVS